MHQKNIQHASARLWKLWQTYLTTLQFKRPGVDLEGRYIHWMLLSWSSDMQLTKRCARNDWVAKFLVLGVNLMSTISVATVNFMCQHVPSFQEAQLCFPHRYLTMLGPCPSEPRALKSLEKSKKQSYLEIAKIFLKKWPCESTRRACKFILRLCNNEAPQAVPRLEWFEKPPADQILVNLRAPSSLSKIAPLMRFSAVLRRWEDTNYVCAIQRKNDFLQANCSAGRIFRDHHITHTSNMIS